MRLIVIFLFSLIPFLGFSQFQFGNTTNTIDSVYRVNQTDSTNTGKVLEVGVGNAFSVSMWINIYQDLCDGVALQAGDFKISLIKGTHYNSIIVRAGIKDSIVAESRSIGLNISELIEPTQLNTHLVVTYDGTNSYTGFEIYINGVMTSPDNVSNLAISGWSQDTIYLGTSECSYQYYNVYNYESELIESQVKTLATSVDATLSGATLIAKGSEKYKRNWFFDQMFRGWKMKDSTLFVGLPIWGGQQNLSNAGHVYQSPFASYFIGPYIVYDREDSISYIITTSRGGPGFSRTGYLCSFDHNTKKFQVLGRTEIPDDTGEYTRDDHLTNVIALSNDNSIIIAREQQHNDAINIHKTPRPNINTEIYRVSEIPETDSLAYPHLFYLHDTLYCVVRKEYDKQHLYRSTDNGVTWSAKNTLTEVHPDDWAYSIVKSYKDSIVYHFTSVRDKGGSGGSQQWEYLAVLKSTDGINFCTLDDSRCEDIRTGVWDIDELRAYAGIDSTTNSTSVLPFSKIITSDGVLHTIVRKGDPAGMTRHIWYDDGWNYDTLTTTAAQTDWFLTDGQNGNYTIFTNEQLDGVEAIFKSTTTDFQTFSNRTLIYKSRYDVGVSRFASTDNAIPGDPILFAATIIIDKDREQTGLFLYEYNPNE